MTSTQELVGMHNNSAHEELVEINMLLWYQFKYCWDLNALFGSKSLDREKIIKQKIVFLVSRIKITRQRITPAT